MTQILLLNGPNLNLLGLRQPEIYGHETLADVVAACTALAAIWGCRWWPNNPTTKARWSIRSMPRATALAGIIINPGAYSHTSVAILDALNAYDGPVLEVHISNIHRREAFRHHSFVSPRAEGVVAGFGTEGYLMALRRMATLVTNMNLPVNEFKRLLAAGQQQLGIWNTHPRTGGGRNSGLGRV